MEIKIYPNAGEYLRETESYLEENELLNNLLIGLSRNLDPYAYNKEYHFVNVLRNGKILASSIKTWKKAILAFAPEEEEAVRKLAEYYRSNAVSLLGVNAETKTAELFASSFHPNYDLGRRMYVQHLESINSESTESYLFRPATMSDHETVHDFLCRFEEESGFYPKRSSDELANLVNLLIEKKDLFVLISGETILSMAALIRRSKNYGIIGYVYTPPLFRSKGYGKECVLRLSNTILKIGFRYCGLFSDSTNLAADGIYSKLGYQKIAEFSDIDFLD